MYRTGVMAPPDLYERPAQPGLLTAAAGHETHEVSFKSFLWCVALVLGLVELLVQSFD
ncbi:MAG TPA: hypothetical protein VI142_09510 [Gaiellaceae bacterium]